LVGGEEWEQACPLKFLLCKKLWRVKNTPSITHLQ